MILNIQFSAKKSQKNICYTEIHTPVEEFMSFKEELVFTGVNHPSYLFSNILKKDGSANFEKKMLKKNLHNQNL